MYATRASTRTNATERCSNRVVNLGGVGDIQSSSLVDDNCSVILQGGVNDNEQYQEERIVRTVTQNSHSYHPNDNDDVMIVSSNSTTMPSSPETLSTHDHLLTSSHSDHATATMTPMEPSPMILSTISAMGDGNPNAPQSPFHRTSTGHDDCQSRRSSCTGLSALIHAASFQLEYLAEVATSLHNHHTEEGAVEQEEQQSSTYLEKSNVIGPFSNTQVDNQQAPSSIGLITIDNHRPKSLDGHDFLIQLMRLCSGCYSGGSETNDDATIHDKPNHESVDDMITFLPNGQYFAVRTTTFSRYLQSTNHHFYRSITMNTPHTDEQVHTSTDIKTTLIQEPQGTKEDNPLLHQKTRIRTIREFVEVLVLKYGFLLITHREQQNSSTTTITNGAITTELQHVTDSTNGDCYISNATDPSATTTQHSNGAIPTDVEFAEILIFRHVNFIEGNYDQLSKIVPQVPSRDRSSDEINNDIEVTSSNVSVPKRRLSPGFLQQQEEVLSSQSSLPLVNDNPQHHHQHVPVKQKVAIIDATTTLAMSVDSTMKDSNAKVISHDENSSIIPIHDETTNVRKSSSGNQSDVTIVTNITSCTSESIGATSVPTTSNIDMSVDSFNGTTNRVIVQQRASDRRNVATTIATEKLQLPSIVSAKGADTTPRNSTTCEMSLVEMGMNICTKEIVISAIECLLVDIDHSYNVYQQNLTELSKSSLPNLIPICQHIFKNHHPVSQSITAIDTKSSVIEPSNGPSLP